MNRELKLFHIYHYISGCMARTRATRRRGRNSSRRYDQMDFKENDHEADILPNPLPDFFSDPANPYQSASKQIKEFFTKQDKTLKFKAKQLEEQLFSSIQRPHKYSNICMNDISEGGYLCYTCFPSDNFRICNDCFVEQDHKNHYYRAGLSNNNSHIYCGCGRPDKQKLFNCNKHNGQCQKINEEGKQTISENQQYLIQYYSKMLEILFYINRRKQNNSQYKDVKDQIMEHLKTSFNKLLSKNGALIFCGLRIVERKVVVRPSEQKHPVSILEYILRMDFSDFLVPMCQNIEFCKKVFSLWSQPENSNIQDINYRSQFSGLQENIIWTILKIKGMMTYIFQQKTIPTKCHPISYSIQHQKPLYVNGQSTFLLYLLNLKSKANKKKQYIEEMSGIRDRRMPLDAAKFMIKQIFDYATGKLQLQELRKEEKIELTKQERKQKEQGQKEVKQEQNQAKQEENQDKSEEASHQEQSDSPEDQSKQEQEESTIKQNLLINQELSPQKSWRKKFKNSILKSNYDSINQLMIQLVSGNFNNFETINSQLSELGISEQTLDEYLFACLYYREKDTYINRYNDVVFFLLAENSKYKEKLIGSYLKKIFDDETQMMRITRNFLNIIKEITSSVMWGYEHIYIDESIEKKLQTYLRYFLYSSKKIPVYELSNYKYDHNPLFCLKNSNDIINQLCQINRNLDDEDQEGECVYVSDQQWKSDLFKLTHENGNLFDLDYFKFGDTPDISEYPFYQRVLRSILSQKCFYDSMTKKFEEYIKKLNKDESQRDRCRQRNIALKYLYYLVLIYHFGNSKELGVDKFLNELRDSEETLKKYQTFCDRNNLEKLLSIASKKQPLNAEEIKENEEKQKEALKKLKEKAKSKKNKIKEKYKQNTQHFLGLHATKSLNEKDKEQQQQCLLCREPQKQNNPLAYIALVNKNQTLSYALFGESDMSKIVISSCFHTIHLMCFTKIEKKNGFFTCLLCQKQCNTLIPMNYDRQNKKVLKICENILIANIVYNYHCLEVESLFMLLFKHLVSAKGLDIFAYASRSTNLSHQKNKLNRFIEDFIQQIFEKSSESERQHYLQELKEFELELEKCERLDLKVIQKIISKAIQCTTIDKQYHVDAEQMNNLRKLLNYEDYEIIKDQLLAMGVDFTQGKQMEQGKLENQPKSLVFWPIVFPEKHTELSKLGKDVCCKCAKKIKFYICLICGETLCQQCNESNGHKLVHKQRQLYYLFPYDDFQVKINKKTYSDYIYRNIFGIFLSDISYSNGCNLDAFNLEKHKVQKLMKRFFEEI